MLVNKSITWVSSKINVKVVKEEQVSRFKDIMVIFIPDSLEYPMPLNKQYISPLKKERYIKLTNINCKYISHCVRLNSTVLLTLNDKHYSNYCSLFLDMFM